MATHSALPLGARIAECRRKASLSQEQLAERAKVSYSTLSKIERGAIRHPSVFTVADIAKALEINIDILLQHSQPSGKRKAKSQISFIYFDVHGVLVTNWQRAFTALGSRFNVDPHVLEMAFWRYNDMTGRGHISVKEFEIALSRNLQLEVERLPFEEVYFESLRPNKEVHALLFELSKTYQIGLFTNIFPGFLEKLIKQGAVPDIDYAAIAESCEVGAVKPENAIYDYAQAEAGINSEHILLIDDTRANLDTAEHLGWQTYWFDETRGISCVKALRQMLISS